MKKEPLWIEVRFPRVDLNSGGCGQQTALGYKRLKGNDVLECGEQLLEVTIVSTRQRKDDSPHVGIIHHGHCVDEIIRNRPHFRHNNIEGNEHDAKLEGITEENSNIVHGAAHKRQHTKKDAENERNDGEGHDSHFPFVLLPFDLHADQRLPTGDQKKGVPLKQLLQLPHVAQQLDDHVALQHREDDAVGNHQRPSREDGKTVQHHRGDDVEYNSLEMKEVENQYDEGQEEV